MARVVPIGLAALAALAGIKLAASLSGLGPLPDLTGAATAAESTPEPEVATPGPATEIPLPGTAAVLALPELLAAIAVERDALAARAAALDLRAAEIELARAAVQKQNAELTRLREDVAALLERAKGGEAADVARLVKIYEAMKPAEAAIILSEADLELAVLVITAMAERNAGPIMAAMAPDRANAVSRIMLERGRLPGDQVPVVVQLD